MRILLFLLTAMISLPAAAAVMLVHAIVIVARIVQRRQGQTKLPKPTFDQVADFERRMEEHRRTIATRGVTVR